LGEKKKNAEGRDGADPQRGNLRRIRQEKRKTTKKRWVVREGVKHEQVRIKTEKKGVGALARKEHETCSPLYYPKGNVALRKYN